MTKRGRKAGPGQGGRNAKGASGPRPQRKRAAGKQGAKRSAPRGKKRRSLAGWIARAAAGAVAVVVLLPLLLVGPCRWINPPTSAFILRDAATPPVPRAWVPIAAISPALQIAVVASEDQKFPVHRGFDVDQIALALQEEGRARGASTITQQVAKNLYLWPGRSLVRKGLEAYLTLWIEWSWPKRRILEVYLNIAEFGPGVFGAAPASRHFFGKEARALSAREAALLAAVLPSPRRMHAGRPSEYVRKRAGEIEAAVRSLGGAAYLERKREPRPAKPR